MCPFDFYGLEDDSLISARFDGRDIKVRIRICPCCERKYTSLKYFDDLKTIRIKGTPCINLNLPEYRKRTMVELNENGMSVEKREKTVEEKIIDILKERQEQHYRVLNKSRFGEVSMPPPTYRHMNCIVVFNKTKEAVLFCKRMNDHYKGCLNFIGGKVEQGEASIDAAYRGL